jgi:hypothetical protein
MYTLLSIGDGLAWLGRRMLHRPMAGAAAAAQCHKPRRHADEVVSTPTAVAAAGSDLAGCILTKVDEATPSDTVIRHGRAGALCLRWPAPESARLAYMAGSVGRDPYRDRCHNVSGGFLLKDLVAARAQNASPPASASNVVRL